MLLSYSRPVDDSDPSDLRLNDEIWENLCGMARYLCKDAIENGIRLNGRDFLSPPQIDSEIIFFNGSYKSCELFVFHRNVFLGNRDGKNLNYYQFSCDTGYKPYGLYVFDFLRYASLLGRVSDILPSVVHYSLYPPEVVENTPTISSTYCINDYEWESFWKNIFPTAYSKLKNKKLEIQETQETFSVLDLDQLISEALPSKSSSVSTLSLLDK